MSFPTSRIYLAVGVVAVGLYFLLPDSGQNFGFILIGISALVAILVGVWRHRPDKSLPWYTIACGLLMFVIGDTVWAYYENVLGVESPFPSVADGFYLLGYPLLAAGLAHLVALHSPAGDRSGLIDAAIVTAGAGLISWVTFMEPYASDPALSLIERLISISYPLADVLLIAVVAGLLFKPGPYRPAYYLLASSLVLLLIADIFYAQLALTDGYETGNPIDAGWLLSYLLLGAAALHPSMGSLSSTESASTAAFTGARWVLLSLALALVPITLLLHPPPHDDIYWPVLSFGAALVALVLARMVIIVRSHERTIFRERVLRDASAELIKAPDRQHIYAAAQEAVLPFIKEAPGTRVSVWSGSPEKDRCVASAGHRAEDIRGKETYISDFPDWLRVPLLEGKTVDLKPGQPAGVREAFRFATKVGAIFMVPLMVKGRFEGRIVVASDSALSQDIHYVLQTLGIQVSLALERNALDEELQFRRLDELFRKLVQNSSDIITVLDMYGTIRYESPSVEQILGYEPEEMTGKNAVDYVHPDDLEDLLAAVTRVIEESETQVSVEYRFAHKSGAWCYLESKATNLLDDPEIGGVVLNSRDVTGRKQDEEELRKSEERNRAIIQAYPDLMFRLNREGEYLDYQANDSAELYIPREEIIGNNIRDTLPPDVAAGALHHLARTFETGIMQIYEHQLAAPEGLLDFEARFVATGEDEALCIIRDVTERNRAQAALRESEEQFRALFDQTAAGVCLADLDRRLMETNAAYQEITGYSAEELVGMSTLELTHPDDRAGDISVTERSLETGQDSYLREKRYVRKDGRVIWARTNSTLVRDELGEPRYIMGVVEDVTKRKRAEERLREAEARFRLAFDNTGVGMALTSPEGGGYLRVNRATCEMLGYSEEELLTMDSLTVTHPDDRDETTENARRLLEGEIGSYQHEKRYLHVDGHTVWASVSISLVRNEEGSPLYFVVQMQDITERKRAEETMRESEERYRAVVERATDGIYIYDFRTKRLLEANTALQNMLGYTSEELLEMTIYDVIANNRESIDRNTRRIEEYKSVFLGERRYRRKNGSVADMESSVTLIPYGGTEAACCIVRDITERKALEEQLSHQAFHDPLTGLPNRLLFRECVDHALARARRRDNRIAILFMDLDNFKDVNDGLGHDAGDQLLISVAELLRKTIRPGDTVARFGGDEFTVLLEEVADTSETEQVAERIQEALQTPLVIAGHEIFVTASIGIKISSSTQDRPEELLSHADLAMYSAKNKGKSRYEGFVPGMETRAFERMQLDNDLRRAIERDELKVYYQPELRLVTNPREQSGSLDMDGRSISGMEALVRWEHPDQGVVGPAEFISAAEETGLIIPIGRRVLVEACQQARSWQERYPAIPPLVMCVNLSPREFQHPDLIQDIAQVLQETGLDPECLLLEVTESAVMEEAESTINVLRGLRNLGVKLAIDDFGTGYSSLSYLKSFPMDSLKIDHSFIKPIEEEPDTAAIVSGIITLAHTLEMEVIAEGVETVGQAECLRRMGCDLAQGDYFSEPLPGEAAGELLAAKQSSHSYPVRTRPGSK